MYEFNKNKLIYVRCRMDQILGSVAARMGQAQEEVADQIRNNFITLVQVRASWAVACWCRCCRFRCCSCCCYPSLQLRLLSPPCCSCH